MMNAMWNELTAQRFMDAGIPRTLYKAAADTTAPRAFESAWNDDMIVANQSAGIMTDGTKAMAFGLNAPAKGMLMGVSNPLNAARKEGGGSESATKPWSSSTSLGKHPFRAIGNSFYSDNQSKIP